MKRLTIKTKLILGLAAILFLTVILGMGANIIEKEMMEEHKITNDYLNRISLLKEIKESQIIWVSKLKDVLLFNETFDEELDYTKCDFGRWYYTYVESDDFTNSSADYKEIVLDMEELHKELHNSAIEVISKWEEDKHEEARVMFEKITIEKESALMELINKADMNLSNETITSVNRANKLMEYSEKAHNLSIITSFLISIIIAFFLIRITVVPLSKLTKRIQRMNENESYEMINDVHTDYEINQLVTVFNKMVNKVNTQQLELQDQNEELIAQGEELTAQNEEILENQKELQNVLVKVTAHEERINRLYTFSNKLNSTIELDELLDSALKGLLDEVNAQVGAFMLYDEENKELRVSISFGLLTDECLLPLKLGTGLAGRAALEKEVIIANYTNSELLSQGLNGKLAMASEIYLPLIIDKRLLGIVILGRLDTVPFEGSDKKHLIALCDQVAVALDNALTHLETQKALGKVQEVDQLKSEMINTVSHELRTPLASILGFSELLLVKQPNPDKARKYITTIHTEAERLQNLINDFLDLQKIENGRMEFVKKQIDLSELIRSCTDVYSGHNEHSLIINIEEKLPLISTDPDRLKQVIGNLLSNAIKYSPKGGEVEVKAYQDSSKTVTISVKDQGLGIPEEARQHLFEPFYRVDNSDRRQIGGTGLGLAICRKIIKTLGGDIWVQSVYGQGSTFTFTLPLQ